MRKMRFIICAVVLCAAAGPARAQYYELANQLTNVLSTALSGSLNYKGFVDVSGTAGVGDNRANFIGVSTTQGFTYADWFFMGAGLGIDAAVVRQSPYDWGGMTPSDRPSYYDRPTTRTKVMMPIFSDFRFTIGGMSSTAFFVDLKIGAAWLLGDSYLEMGDAYMSNSAQFYFKPSVGIRIPVSTGDSRHAFNIGVTYQLLTSGNNYYWYDDTVTLNNLGATISYEW